GYRDRLQGAGFTNVAAQNWRGFGISEPTVLYNRAADRPTAEAVARVLGYPVQQSSGLQMDAVAVVVFG
ncbi:MAG: LytR C-terminal domain-containing protein, partial [Micrococcus sp.]|nr:LytR C-terminal domain-containing protein [Micrococcus sp.]